MPGTEAWFGEGGVTSVISMGLEGRVMWSLNLEQSTGDLAIRDSMENKLNPFSVFMMMGGDAA